MHLKRPGFSVQSQNSKWGFELKVVRQDCHDMRFKTPRYIWLIKGAASDRYVHGFTGERDFKMQIIGIADQFACQQYASTLARMALQGKISVHYPAKFKIREGFGPANRQNFRDSHLAIGEWCWNGKMFTDRLTSGSPLPSFPCAMISQNLF